MKRMLSIDMKFTMRAWRFLFFIINLIPAKAQTDKVNLVEIGNCVAGAPCLRQPRGKLLNPHGIHVEDFVAGASTQMDTSLTGFEVLHQGTCDFDGRCGSVMSDRVEQTPMINGHAALQVKKHVSNSLFSALTSLELIIRCASHQKIAH